ncbi:hypothetical protein [Glaciimonas sp. PCH181]|uniref:hypothetical protein n=1 Tax=Glaciimonas sp. PCH181 TaxID=2133943 RepID=UPI000D365DA5|nr:hypothetical protein [Glaciimonas sp. PCH181]PUA19164.1 hypothetical protein C7W93_04525 [Glaciimonas sp. PCH181]
MTMVFCRGCAKEIHESAPLCPQCGASQPTNISLQQKKESPSGVAITALMLTCLSFLACLVSEGDKDSLFGVAAFAITGAILGGINLQQRRSGKTIAIVSVVLACITLLLSLGQIS